MKTKLILLLALFGFAAAGFANEPVKINFKMDVLEFVPGDKGYKRWEEKSKDATSADLPPGASVMRLACVLSAKERKEALKEVAEKNHVVKMEGVIDEKDFEIAHSHALDPDLPRPPRLTNVSLEGSVTLSADASTLDWDIYYKEKESTRIQSVRSRVSIFDGQTIVFTSTKEGRIRVTMFTANIEKPDPQPVMILDGPEKSKK